MRTRNKFDSAVEATIEPLERRTLFSGYSSLHAIVAIPQGAMVLDSNGDLFGAAQANGAMNGGYIFELPKGATTINLLYSFTQGNDGQDPQSNLVIDSAGDLFGTTSSGGPDDGGAVFELPAGASNVTVLHSFTGGADGANPVGGVVLDSSGDVFGTTSSGGADSDGTVYEIPSGTTALNTIHTFTGTPDGKAPAGALTKDSSGNIFGTTTAGGTHGDGTIFELAKGASNIITLYSFTGGTDGSDPYGGVSIDSSGNLYGTNLGGGARNISGGAVFELPHGSRTVNALYDFPSNGDYPQSGVVVDSAGNLYGTAQGGGTNGAGMLYEISSGSNTLTVLHSFAIDGNGSQPYALPTLDGNGNLFGTTQNSLDPYFYRSGAGVIFEFSVIGSIWGGGGGGVGGGTTTTSSLTPTVISSTVPNSVIGGAKLHGVVKVAVDNTAAAVEKGFTVKLFASTETTLGSTDTLVATVVKSATSIKAGRTTIVPVPINSLPANLLDGSYYLLAEIIDSSGDIATAATRLPVVVATPFVTLSETITGKFPAVLVSGTTARGTVTVTITNSGNVPSTGITPIEITASTSSGLLGTTILTMSKSLSVPPGKPTKVVIPIKNTPVLADGNYFLVAQVTDPFAGAISQCSSIGPITVAAPFITLAAALGPVTRIKSGDTLTVTNNGNIADDSSFTATIGFSLDAHGLQPVGRTTSAAKTYHIKVGKSVKIHSTEWSNILSGLEPGMPYFLTVSISDSAGNTAFAVSTTSFTS